MSERGTFRVRLARASLLGRHARLRTRGLQDALDRVLRSGISLDTTHGLGSRLRNAAQLTTSDQMLVRALAGTGPELRVHETSSLPTLPAALATLRAMERELATTACEDSLQTMGYDVAVASADHRDAIWAERGDQVMALLVADGGAIEIDVAGCADLTCRDEVGRLTTELRRHGLEASGYQSRWHGDPDGGALIADGAAAARRLEIDRVGGLLASSEPAGHDPAPGDQSDERGRRLRIVRREQQDLG